VVGGATYVLVLPASFDVLYRAAPNAGLYASTKFALRGISETLHEEIAPLGLRSICIDFGYFRTSFLNPGHRHPYESRIEDYREMGKKSDAALIGEQYCSVCSICSQPTSFSL